MLQSSSYFQNGIELPINLSRVLDLANTLQARKRVRQQRRRHLRSAPARAKVRTYIKQCSAAIEAGDKKKATEVLKSTISVLDRSANKGFIHRNKAARHKRILAAGVNKLS